MSHARWSVAFCLVFILISAVLISAGIPQYVNIQGQLTDDVGTPLDGDQELLFCIYEFSAGGDPLWCSSNPVIVTVTDGLFDHLLGSSLPLPDTLVNYDSLYVGITVGVGTELVPRIPMVTVGYAIKAQRADEGGGWTTDESAVYLTDDTDSVGIGTDAPEARLDVHGGVRVGDGTVDSDVDFYGLSPEHRFHWNANKRALRFGRERPSYVWEEAILGDYSFGIGDATTASGFNAVAIGNFATATGNFAFSFGNSCTAEGDYSAVLGAGSSALGLYSLALGKNVDATGENSMVIGGGIDSIEKLVNPHDYSLIIGFGDTLHTMFIDGDSVNINGSLSVSTGEFNDVNFYGMEADTRFFWDASKAALRLGLENVGVGSWDDANIGRYSFAPGYKNIASGDRSVALGCLGNASGFASFVAGFSSVATGGQSMAIGAENEATAQYSIAIGNIVNATAQYAIALGKGIDYFHPLENNIESSLMVGFSDSLVSLFVEDGAVGVGTSAPEDMLHIKNSNAGGRAFLWIESDHATEWNEAGLRFETPENRWHFRMDDYVNKQIPVGALGLRSQNLNGEVMTWEENGEVGIGVTTPGYKLDVAGSVHASSFPTSSDERFKENVTRLDGVLAKLQRVRGVRFEWNDRYAALGRSTGHTEIGVIAQEIEQVFPELVTTWGEDEYRAVDYGRLSAVLIEAIKELKTENDELKSRIEALERQ